MFPCSLGMHPAGYTTPNDGIKLVNVTPALVQCLVYGECEYYVHIIRLLVIELCWVKPHC